MRHPYTGKKFFSFFDHLEPSQVKALLDSAAPIINEKLENDGVKKGVIFHGAILIRPHRPETEEQVLNNLIGIA